jgi:signal transduction histidine kinase
VEIALRCSPDGTVRETLRLSGTAQLSVNHLAEAGVLGAEGFASLKRALARQEGVFDLTATHGDGSAHVACIRLGDELRLVMSDDRSRLGSLWQLFRDAGQRTPVSIVDGLTGEEALLDELSELNNDLVKSQRDLVKQKREAERLSAALMHQARLQETLIRIGARVLESDAIDAIGAEIAPAVREALDLEYFMLARWSGTQALPFGEACRETALAPLRIAAIELLARPSGQSRDAHEQATHPSAPGLHWLLLPLASGPRQLGSIVCAAVPERSDAEAGRFLQSVAQMLSAALQREQHLSQLHDALARLELSNRELEDFAMVASHDLQAPLRKIQVFSSAVEDGLPESVGPDLRDRLRRLREAASRLQRMISGLLDLSRVVSKAPTLTPVDLRKVALSVLEDLDAPVRESGATVTVGTLPTVYADAIQMHQIVQNLVANALKFSHKGVAPSITLEGGDDANGNGWFRVCDNGIGFAEADAARMFRPFGRLRGQGEYDGSGLGLAIVDRIVRLHGGRIEAAGQPGRGASFTVTLPRFAAEQAPGVSREAGHV